MGAKYIAAITAVLSAFAAGCGGKDTKDTGRKNAGGPPVVVAAVRQQAVPVEVRSIGNVEAYSEVLIKSQVTGQIARVAFQEGQDVQKGQLLFEIDPRQFEQAVRQAEATLADRRASLAQAEANYDRDVANAKNARSQAGRYATLAARGIIAREQNEQYQTQAIAAEKAAAATKATIESARAAIQGAEAAVADARLQLSYTRIRAPISGKTGNLTRKAGNLVTANADPPLVTINQITPAYVTFTVPEQTLNELRRYASGGRLRVEATPQQSTVATQGVLDFLDNRVDESTGTILLKARFANQDRRLWPGQFAGVVVRLATPLATVVPATAVKSAQQGNYVFVVNQDATAEQRTVESSRTWGNLAVIDSGVRPGERVIVEGQLRVRPGAKVRVVERSEVQSQASAFQPALPGEP